MEPSYLKITHMTDELSWRTGLYASAKPLCRSWWPSPPGRVGNTAQSVRALPEPAAGIGARPGRGQGGQEATAELTPDQEPGGGPCNQF